MSEYIDSLVSAVNSGKISEKNIDAAVIRILKLKEKYGITDMSTYDDKSTEALAEEARKTVGSAENHNIEWKITSKAIIMVKNDGTVPIKVKENEKVLVFCPYSNEVNSVISPS